MPKIVNRDTYRLELLTQSFKLFARYGYASISMRKIAEELGISTGTLYHYFPSKEELFKQIAIVLSQYDISQIVQLMEQSTSLEERLDLLFSHVQEDETEILYSLLFAFDFYRLSSEEDKETNFIRATRRDYQELLAKLIGLPSDLAKLVFAAMDGLVLHRAIEPEEINLNKQLNLLKEIIIKQIKTG